MGHYQEYLRTVVYPRMAQWSWPWMSVMEIGARPELGDRGIMSPRIIPHKTFVTVDRKPGRGAMCLDVQETPIWADVILSTCVLHHTPKEDIPILLKNLHAPVLMFVGPDVKKMPTLLGDHEWHIEEEWLREQLEDGLGYSIMHTEPSGSGELFIVAWKR